MASTDPTIPTTSAPSNSPASTDSSKGYQNPIDDAKFNQIMQGTVPQFASAKPQSAYDRYLANTKVAPPPPNPNTWSGQVSMLKNSPVGKVAQGIGDTFKSGAQDLIKTGQDVYNKTEQTPNVGLGEKVLDYGQAAGNIAGTVAKTAGGLIGNIISPLLPKTMKENQAFDTQQIDNSIKQIPGMTPQIHQALGDVLNTALLAGGAKGEGSETGAALKTATQEVVPKVIDTLGQVGGKISDTAGQVSAKAGELAKGLGEKVSPSVTAPELVGKITQAAPNEIPKLQSGLSAIDTKGVKTFSDLSSKAQEAIDTNQAKVDEALNKNTTPLKVQSLATPVKVGDTVLHHNYVLDAIDQLKNYYSKTNDIPNLQRMENLSTKLNPTKGVGLTLKEVNDLAREHGTALNAYNANGELASGLTKQAAENTRAGLKETVRQAMPDDVTRGLDKQTSQMIKVKDAANEMATKVQQLQNKFQKAGVLQKFAGYAGKAGNVVSGGVLKGLFKGITGLGSVEGQSLNAIDLEASLGKNLTKLNELLKMKPADALKAIQKLSS